MDRLITIATFETPFEADVANGVLEAHGIRSVVTDANMVATIGIYSTAVGGVKLQVLERDATRAREVMGVPPVDVESTPRDSTSAEELVQRALAAAFWGLLFVPLQLYSLWLALGLVKRSSELSSASRRKLAITCALDIWVFVVAGIWLYLRFGRMQ